MLLAKAGLAPYNRAMKRVIWRTDIRAGRRSRRRGGLMREARRLALGALGAWAVCAGLITGLALPNAGRPASVGQVLSAEELGRQAAQLAADPWVGPAVAAWWNAAGEPREALRSRSAATPPRPDLAKRLAALAPSPLAGSKAIPILMYHYTPPDFDAQLTHLEQRGYTVIDMDTALAGLAGSDLPAKPVVITFDDGFADQMQAYNILAAHRMRATFYIINGSEASLWCIGAGRRPSDPLQPPEGCGDAYLTWDQIRYLDSSGLITIGGHTFDHPNLTTLDAAGLTHQITESKTSIERELGHSIYHFAYPYGAYNAQVLAATQAAGYLSAVTVEPGFNQSYAGRHQLYRVRNAFELP